MRIFDSRREEIAFLLDSAAAHLTEEASRVENPVWHRLWLEHYEKMLDGQPNLVVRERLETRRSELSSPERSHRLERSKGPGSRLRP